MICKIEGCVEEVMGCPEADDPAYDLCPGHYFTLAYLEGRFFPDKPAGDKLRRELKNLLERDGLKLENYRRRSMPRGGF